MLFHFFSMKTNFESKKLEKKENVDDHSNKSELVGQTATEEKKSLSVAERETRIVKCNEESELQYVFVKPMENKYWTSWKDALLYEKGLQLMGESESQDAILCFEALVGHPKNAKLPTNIQLSDVWRMLGECQMENECELLAIAAFEQCLKMNHNDVLAMVKLAMAYANEGDSNKVIHYLCMCLQRNGTYKQWLDRHHKTYPNEANANIAFELIDLYLGIAVDEKETNVETHKILGVLYSVTTDFSKATDQFKICVRLQPDNHALWNQLGACLSNAGLFKSALDAYQKAIDRRPNYVRALTNMAVAHFNDKHFDTSCQYYLKALLQNPNADVWEDFASTLRAANKGKIADLILAYPEKRDIKQIWLLCIQH
ncbi:hypothetical protein RFI_08549 [Reticulomyxa filosa]|uniref:Uncharacterized protein n=1 Tax=Reticulomyxa filosa TaxID=46433 RepID=X6NRD2_RETFI|nr:hypothetical protein RFI_08549 [Reticulomyxa filosa]|eukprot:ETO28581.1 hypothetical protein RFI_08549 [Reticulomyxa filosa]